MQSGRKDIQLEMICMSLIALHDKFEEQQSKRCEVKRHVAHVTKCMCNSLTCNLSINLGHHALQRLLGLWRCLGNLASTLLHL